MDQSVTIDGQRVLLNGEPVAEALGDFSVRVLAEAIVLHSKMVAEANDDDYPDSYWCQCRLVAAQKSVSTVLHVGVVGIDPGVLSKLRAGSVVVKNQSRHTSLTGRIYANSCPAGLSHLAPKREEMTAERFAQVFSQQGGHEKLLGLPAPADLLVKAREYYPDNEGLLRMYADCRGYSCDQVAEAIDHAKRL